MLKSGSGNITPAELSARGLATKRAENVDEPAENRCPATKRAENVDGEARGQGSATKNTKNVDGGARSWGFGHEKGYV